MIAVLKRWLEAARRRLRSPGDAGTGELLQDGAALLVIVKHGALLHHTHDVALSHAEFVRRSAGTLPEGAWVGTIRKTGGEVIAMSSRTFYGNQLPAPLDVMQAIRARFR
jgi:hypothetical protein